MERRLKLVRLNKPTIGQNGFMVVDSRVAQEGVYSYEIAGRPRRAYLPSEELKKEKFLNSLGGLSLINGHKDINSDNISQESLGALFNVKFANSQVLANIRVHDKATMERITNAEEALDVSVAYNSNLVKKDGVFDGEAFDCIQTNLDATHLAIVDAPNIPESKIQNQEAIMTMEMDIKEIKNKMSKQDEDMMNEMKEKHDTLEKENKKLKNDMKEMEDKMKKSDEKQNNKDKEDKKEMKNEIQEIITLGNEARSLLGNGVEFDYTSKEDILDTVLENKLHQFNKEASLAEKVAMFNAIKNNRTNAKIENKKVEQNPYANTNLQNSSQASTVPKVGSMGAYLGGQ